MMTAFAPMNLGILREICAFFFEFSTNEKTCHIYFIGYFLRTGGRSVQTPSQTSAAIPIDSPSVG